MKIHNQHFPKIMNFHITEHLKYKKNIKYDLWKNVDYVNDYEDDDEVDCSIM